MALLLAIAATDPGKKAVSHIVTKVDDGVASLLTGAEKMIQATGSSVANSLQSITQTVIPSSQPLDPEIPPRTTATRKHIDANAIDGPRSLVDQTKDEKILIDIADLTKMRYDIDLTNKKILYHF